MPARRKGDAVSGVAWQLLTSQPGAMRRMGDAYTTGRRRSNNAKQRRHLGVGVVCTSVACATIVV
jgi:hypothetical protein